MVDYKTLDALAIKCGFTKSAPLQISTLEFMQEIRDMCSADRCGNYGKSWSCPPACPPLDEMRDLICGYSNGLLVQTIGELEDTFDWDNIFNTEAKHKINFNRLRDELLGFPGYEILALGSGACSVCGVCAYPGEPCRFPEKIELSMEACGMFVSKICADNNLGYNYGHNKTAFTACYFFNEGIKGNSK